MHNIEKIFHFHYQYHLFEIEFDGSSHDEEGDLPLTSLAPTDRGRDVFEEFGGESDRI